MFLTIFFLICWTLFGLACSKIAKSKNRSPITWFYLGFLLGIFGLVIIASLSRVRKEEPIILNKEPSPTLELSSIDPTLSLLRQKHWYYLDPSHNQFGPMSFDVFKKAYDEGKFTLGNFIWNEDLSDWKALADLDEYHPYFDIKKPETT